MVFCCCGFDDNSSIEKCMIEARNLKQVVVLRLYMKLQAGGWSIILSSREHGKHQNVTINHLLSAGFSGWSSLMMRYCEFFFLLSIILDND